MPGLHVFGDSEIGCLLTEPNWRLQLMAAVIHDGPAQLEWRVVVGRVPIPLRAASGRGQPALVGAAKVAEASRLCFFS